jgi:hypothetical protein
MNTFSFVFGIIDIVGMVFLFGNQVFAYGYYGDYGGYPYGGYYDPGSPPPYAYCSYADYKKNVPLYGDCYYYPFSY